MATLSVILKKVTRRPKGNVFIQYTIDQKASIFGTDVSVEPKYFEKKTRHWIKSSHPGSKTMNGKITKKFAELDDAIRKLGDEPSIQELKDELNDNKKDKNIRNWSLSRLYSEYLENLPHTRASTKTAKNSALLHWKGFTEVRDYKIKELNPLIYDKFRTYLINTLTLAPSTVGKSIKDIKACLNWANERGYFDAESWGKINIALWKTKKQKPANLHYLQFDELQQIINFKSKSNYLKKVKDLTILQCHTGLRISDLKSITHSGNFIRMHAKKTGEVIQVPITSLAQSILKKYDNKSPSISDQKFNQYHRQLLREVGIDRKVDMPRHQFNKLSEERKKRVHDWQVEKGFRITADNDLIPVPYYELASSHANVRTFITLAAENGMTPKTISRITGKTVKVILENYLGTSEQALIREMESFGRAFQQS